MTDKKILLHGSTQIIEVPELSKGNSHNDYGRGFYCTESEEMAREWACREQKDGFVNRYLLDTSHLKILNLCDGTHHVLNWIAILLKNRTFRLQSSIAVHARAYLIAHYAIDTSADDLIEGYRADDSYFQYAESFIENALPLRSLSNALTLGKLGMQTVLVSEKAFEQLQFIDVEPVDEAIYYKKYMERDTTARKTYSEEIAKRRSYRDDIFVLDILREEMRNDDPRIQRNLCI